MRRLADIDALPGGPRYAVLLALSLAVALLVDLLVGGRIDTPLTDVIAAACVATGIWLAQRSRRREGS